MPKFVNLLCKPKGLQLIDICSSLANSSQVQLQLVAATRTNVHPTWTARRRPNLTYKCPPLADTARLLSTCYVNLRLLKYKFDKSEI